MVHELTSGDIVIMGNPSSYKEPDASEATEAAGASLLFLLPYSPDFRSIEQAFLKIKAHL